MRAVIGAMLAIAALAGPSGLHAQDSRFFRIGTAATGGSYYPIGSLIANAISAPPGSRPCDQGGSCGVAGLIASAVATRGSVANAMAIQNGTIESGLVQGDVASWAYRGTGPWTAPAATKLRAIANLYPETLHLVVSTESGIHSVMDLRGKAVSLDEAESGTKVDAELLLGAAGLSLADLKPQYLPLGEAVDAMLADDLDAFFFTGGHPATAIAQLASQKPIRIVPVDGDLARKLMSAYPYFSAGILPEDSYQGQDQPVTTLAVGAQWLTSSDQPEALIHDITAALWNDASQRQLQNGPSRGRTIRPEDALNGISIPLHPGAARFYRESGLLD